MSGAARFRRGAGGVRRWGQRRREGRAAPRVSRLLRLERRDFRDNEKPRHRATKRVDLSAVSVNKTIVSRRIAAHYSRSFTFIRKLLRYAEFAETTTLRFFPFLPFVFFFFFFFPPLIIFHFQRAETRRHAQFRIRG